MFIKDFNYNLRLFFLYALQKVHRTRKTMSRQNKCTATVRKGVYAVLLEMSAKRSLVGYASKKNYCEQLKLRCYFCVTLHECAESFLEPNLSLLFIRFYSNFKTTCKSQKLLLRKVKPVP
jgi:hypothetical protein